MKKFILTIQITFYKVALPEKFTWQTVVLTPKGNLGLWVIRLVEVLWNNVLGILN